MYLKEIKYQQSKYYDCVSKFLDEKMFFEKNFHTSLAKACQADGRELSNFYLPFLEKATLNHSFFTSKLFEKVQLAYINLGRFGYNSHLCQSL